MRPFSLTWTAEILEDEALVFVSTVQEALELAWERLPAEGHIVPAPEVRPFGDWVLEDADPETDYGSFQWYQDRAAGGGAGGKLYWLDQSDVFDEPRPDTFLPSRWRDERYQQFVGVGNVAVQAQKRMEGAKT